MMPIQIIFSLQRDHKRTVMRDFDAPTGKWVCQIEKDVTIVILK